VPGGPEIAKQLNTREIQPPPPAGRRPRIPICVTESNGGGQLSVISYQSSVVSYQLSVPDIASPLPSHPSPLTSHLSPTPTPYRLPPTAYRLH
jgi:hypothetical protein